MALSYLILRQLNSRPNYFGYMEFNRLMQLSTSSKPPNILIYSGRNHEVFVKCRELFTRVLEPNCYTIYNIESFNSTSAWIPNTRLLILAKQLEADFHTMLQTYLVDGGQTLAFQNCWPQDVVQESVTVLNHPAEFFEQMENLATLAQVLKNNFQLRCTEHHLLDTRPSDGFLFSLDNAVETLHVKLESNAAVPVHLNAIPAGFASNSYYRHLSTKHLGRTVFYTDVMPSTHSLLEKLGSLKNGFAVICRYQTQGRGRSGNVWLSPRGCAMFSIQLHIALHSALGERLSLVQHLAALAIVKAIKKHAKSTNLDLGVKWPNDIYYGKRIKVGGVLTTSSISGKDVYCNIGCGVNLDNSNPTLSINRILEDHGLPRLEYEKYFAAVFNEMEELLHLLEYNQGSTFYDLYYRNWIHSDAKVTVLEQGTKILCKITGIDDAGYLRVQKPDGTFVSVHPDGNSFDLLNGLIIPK